MRIFLAIFFIFCIGISHGQNEIINNSINFLLHGNQDEKVNIEELSEQFSLLLNHPIDINAANEKEFIQLPLLCATQAQQIIDYRNENGKIISIYELKHLSYSPELIELLNHYLVCASPPEPLANNLFILRTQKDFSTETYNRNQDFKMFSRWRYSRNKVQMGFTLENDQGETFYENNQLKGFDFISGYFQYQTKKSKIIVGDFSVNTAQGLLLSNAFRSIFINSPLYTNLDQNLIKPYTSSNENSFFRGICWQQYYKNFSFISFVSNKKTDAAIENGIIKSFPKTGYHRTLSEIEKRDAGTETTLGNSILYEFNQSTIGISNVYYQYNFPYLSDSVYYKENTIQYHGKIVNSLHYNLNLKNINLFGECALSNFSSLSCIQGFSTSLNKILSLSLRTRYYSKSFTSPYSASYSQNSTAANEKGIDLSALWNFTEKDELILNFDLYEHPFFKYGIKRPSRGKDFSLTYNKTVSKKTSWYFRYQWKNNPLLFDDATIKINHNSYQLRWHIQHQHQLGSNISLRCELHKAEENWGFLNYVNISQRIGKHGAKVFVRYNLYNVSNYSTRIYAFENDMLYTNTMGVYSNKGNSWLLLFNFPIGRYWSAAIKTNISFNNVAVVNDIRIQLVYKD